MAILVAMTVLNRHTPTNQKFRTRHLAWSLLLLSVMALADPSTTRFHTLSIDQGLSQSTVHVAARDADGFLWLGTADGLNRYDGYRFKVFQPDPKDPGSLSGSYVSAIFFDRQGTMWVGTATGGLNRYDKASGKFSHYRHNPADPHSLSHDNVLSVVEDSSGYLWIGTMDGLNRFNPGTGQFRRFETLPDNPDSLSHNVVKALLMQPDDTLWIGTFGGGLNRYDPHQGRIERTINAAQGLSNDHIMALHRDPSGVLWIGTLDGLNRLDSPAGTAVNYRTLPDGSGLSSNLIWAIHRDRQNRLWIATDAGLDQLQSHKDPFIHYRHRNGDLDSLSSNAIRSLFEDQDNNLWIGTYGGGINRMSLSEEWFHHGKSLPNDPNGLSDNRINALAQDNRGDLWLGTYGGGLNHKAAASGQYTRYRHDPDNPNSLSTDSIGALLADSRNNIWVGTLGGGLDRLDRHTGQFRHYRSNSASPSSLSNDGIASLYEDSNGTLWVGTYGGGLNRYNPDTDGFIVYGHDKNDRNSLTNDNITLLLPAHNGKMWVGTYDGLNLFDPQSGQSQQYRHQPEQPHSLTQGLILSGLVDHNGHLWLGTDAGLDHFDPHTNTFRHYRRAQGMASETVNGLLQDSNGFLWLSTNQGISRFDPQTRTFRHYNVHDGLQSNEFSSNAHLKLANGEMVFGGINGYNRFDPLAVTGYQPPGKLVFTELRLFNQPVAVNQIPNGSKSALLPKVLDQLDRLPLNHTHNLVSLEFASLSLVKSMNIEYAYRLRGLSDDWVQTDADNRRATFTHLPAGSYTLEVKARYLNDDWHNEIRALTIDVSPPWWASRGAYFVYLLALLGLPYALYRYRTQSLLKRSQQLETAVKERTTTIARLMAQKERMFANISHEFKTPLTLILNPLATLSRSEDERGFAAKIAMMMRNGQRLLRMVEQLLELTRITDQPIRQEQDYSLANTLNLLLTSFEPLFAAKQLQLHQMPFKDVVLTLTSDSLEIILNNLISNAIKYTPAEGSISILVDVGSEQVAIAVSDTGLGISAEDQSAVFERFTRAHKEHDETIPGAGIGLALVRELVEANQGQLSLQSEPGQGSTFTVTLPISQKSQVGSSGTQPHASTLAEVAWLGHEGQTSKHPAVPDEQSQWEATLLLVDDNADMLELLVQTLSDKYQCYCAENGEQGLALANEHLPDLMISDVMMPVVSGFELLRRLKQNPLTNHIPVILLTAKGDVQSRMTGWEEQADEYLAKPFNAEELRLRIDNLLAIRALLRQRFQQSFGQFDDWLDDLPTDPGLTQVHRAFIRQLGDTLDQHHTNEGLDVALLAEQLALSTRQLSRKLKGVLNLSPNECIRHFRLKKAASLLLDGAQPGAVAFQVGFSSHSYFSRCFKAHFDCLPSNYATVHQQTRSQGSQHDTRH